QVSEDMILSMVWSGTYVVTGSVDALFSRFPLDDPAIGGQQRALSSAFAEASVFNPLIHDFVPTTTGMSLGSKVSAIAGFSACLGAAQICDPQDPGSKASTFAGSIFQRYDFDISPGTYRLGGRTFFQANARNAIVVAEPTTPALLALAIGMFAVLVRTRREGR